jgi:hypothetical protein
LVPAAATAGRLSRSKRKPALTTFPHFCVHFLSANNEASGSITSESQGLNLILKIKLSSTFLPT